MHRHVVVFNDDERTYRLTYPPHKDERKKAIQVSMTIYVLYDNIYDNRIHRRSSSIARRDLERKSASCELLTSLVDLS